MNGGPALVARGLVKTYRVGEVDVPALRGVDLELAAGEITVLLGASGSGKSTLLHLLGGLDVPTSGSVRFRGLDLGGLDDARLTRYRREHVGFVFQGYNLIPSLTALENVELVTEIAADPLPAGDCLGLVGLGSRRDHFPSQLSGGEQQRVAIARAVAKRPGILLCDEPTGALDAATGVRVLETLVSAQRAVGSTVVIITHNAVIASIGDRVIRLSGGRIADERRNATRAAPADLSW